MTIESLIPLNRQIPFVNAIMRVVDGEDAYDEAVALFVAAEDRHGLRVVYDGTTGSRAVGLKPIEGRRPTMQEVLDLNSDNDRLWAYYHEAPDGLLRRMEQDSLFPFISETSCLLGGTDFANDHLILYSSGLLDSWTQRAWGQELAHWANATGWMLDLSHAWLAPDQTGPRIDEWGYIPFTYYLDQIIDGYISWMEVVLRVIQMKCARQLAEEVEQDYGSLT